MNRLTLSLMPLFFAVSPVMGAGVSLTLTLDVTGDWQSVQYVCEERDERLSVDYINAAPNFLALVPVEGETLVFASVLSDAGVRYVSGRYEWWTNRAKAGLIDLIAGADAAPVLTCLEASEIP